jgi:hypothetical protein
LTLILVKISPTVCIPSTFLPALDHTAQNSQQWVTPELGLNSTQVKEFLTRLMYLRQQEKICHRCQLELTTYNPSFPTCLSHPRKCAPSLLNSPSAAPLPFWGFNNRPDRKSQSPVAAVWHLREINSQQFSHLERISHGPDNPPLQYPTGLTTHFFSPSPKTTRYISTGTWYGCVQVQVQ